MEEPFAVPSGRPPAIVDCPPARPAEQGPAASALAGKVLLVARHGGSLPLRLQDVGLGIGLCPDSDGRRIAALGDCDGLPVLADPGCYEREIATQAEPFSVPPDDGRLFGGGVEGLLSDQRARGATLAVTPARYVTGGDSGALEAVVRQAQQVERDDVVVMVALDKGFLRGPSLRQVVDVLRRIPHPKGVILGGQFNPTDGYADISRNLRTLYGEVPDVGLWRTDPATGFDCLAHGGLFAGIGVRGSLRHLVPPQEKVQSGGGRHSPAVFLPGLLSFVRADKLGLLYANTTPPPCTCDSCGGRLLDRFYGPEAEDVRAVDAHNVMAWRDIMLELLAHKGRDRQAWWKNYCEAAVRAHEAENYRLEHADAFVPTRTLETLARLPLTDSAPTALGR
jgi:hypothetical protein